MEAVIAAEILVQLLAFSDLKNLICHDKRFMTTNMQPFLIARRALASE